MAIGRMISQLASDYVGLWRVCGGGMATRWLWNVARHFGGCLRQRNLQPADLALGDGPFRARLGRAQALVAGESIVTGIREVWVRDCYLADGFLSIGANDVVVDLGANLGTFTMLALGHSPGVRVIAVEPNARSNESLLEVARANGWEDRVQLCRGYVGGKMPTQDSMLREAHFQAPFLSEGEFIERYMLTRIDFLKCDIEGSEFELFKRDSPLLAMTRQLSVELHKGDGDAEPVISLLRGMRFEINIRQDNEAICILNARRRL
jgi:FkbM family methyltransferase